MTNTMWQIQNDKFNVIRTKKPYSTTTQLMLPKVWLDMKMTLHLPTPTNPPRKLNVSQTLAVTGLALTLLELRRS